MAIATLSVKLQAQIAEFQAEFKEAARSTEKFQESFQATATKASAYGNLIARGLEIGLEMVQRLGEAALENASKINDLSKKTGLTTDTIQEFQHVAGETGTTVDAFANAAFKLGTNLAGGSKSVVAGVKELGLSFDDLRSKSPDEQFRLTIKALEDMDDQQEANRIGVLLFGRTYREIAVAVAEGYTDLANKTRKMTQDQIDRLAAAEDAWKRFGRTVVIVTGEAIAESISMWQDLQRFLANLTLGDPFKEGPKPLTPDQIAFDKSFDEVFRRQTAERTRAAREAAEAAEDAAERQKKAFEKAQRAAEAYRDSIIKLRDEFSGAKLQGEVRKIQEAFTLLSDEQLRSADIQRRVGESAEKLRQDGARLSPELLTLAVRTEAFSKWLDKVPGQTERWAESFDTLRTALQKPIVQLADLDVALGQIATHKADTFLNFGEQGFDQFENFKSFEEQLSQLPKSIFGDEFGRQLGTLLGNAFRGGDVRGAIEGGASLVGETLLSSLATKLTTGANALTGWLGGMVKTALPLIGSLLGPLVGKIGDLIQGAFGNRGRDAVKDFAASFGGFDALHARLLEMGAAGEALWIKLTQGVGRNNPEQAAAVIAEVTAALDDFGTESERAAARIAGIGTAIDAINAKALAFASPFQNLLKDEEAEDVKAKLAAMGEVGQAEFERIGTFAAAAFAGLVKETGDAIGAIQRLGPTFQVLQDGVEKFGLTSTGTIDALISMFALVNDAVTGPILQAIQTTGQIFAGLQEGGILTAELFQTVATDIGASFRELEAKGGDVAKAMALSQPVLQRLWEAQQTYGAITDETTAKLLEQAEQQGLVGAHMKDVNQKILDVLIAIADVFGAKIPEGMRATQRAATETAQDIQREFGNIKIPNIQVDVDFNVGKLPNPDFTESVRPLASGGIVRRPTLALVGEAGPEAVIPLSQLANVSPSGGEMTAIFEIDGRQVAAATVPYLPGEIRRYVPA